MQKLLGNSPRYLGKVGVFGVEMEVVKPVISSFAAATGGSRRMRSLQPRCHGNASTSALVAWTPTDTLTAAWSGPTRRWKERH